MKYSQTCIQMLLMTREPEIVAFMNSCPLYAGYNFMHYSLMRKRDCPL